MTRLVAVRADEGGGTTEERVGTGGNDDTFRLTLLAGRAGEALVAQLLALGEGFTRERGLVNRNVDGLRQSAVGGDDVTDLEGDHVTGDEVGRLDFVPVAVTLDLGLGCEGVHEGLDGISGVVFFVETDGGVDEEEEDDTDKVLPIGGHALTVG